MPAVTLRDETTAATGRRGREAAAQASDPAFKVSILTGGGDMHYAIPLSVALAHRGLDVEVIGSTQFLASKEFKDADLRFVNAHGDMDSGKPLHSKVLRVLREYVRLIRYVARTDSPILHILWHNKFKLFDQTLLTAYYKVLGKKLLFTAHNVDIGERDGKGGFLSTGSLRIMYRMMDHIFVHTAKMKAQLERDFRVPGGKVTVIPFGMNTVPPRSELTRSDARKRLGIGADEKVALFFGNIAPYKGLEYLVEALGVLKNQGSDSLKLLVAGSIKGRQALPYWKSIEDLIEERGLKARVRTEIRYLRDDEIEVFFKSADVCVLPYVYISQTGVLFLSYRYGVPAVVTDAGSMSEDVIEGRTGFVCRSSDAVDLARALTACFDSRLVVDRERTRDDIVTYAEARYSWESITQTITQAYETVRHGDRRTA